VILKQAASGATAFGKRTVVHQPPVVLGDPVDSIGAGDALDAGCLLGVLEGWTVEKCIRVAATAPASR
jgi:2-dehydro-3-deoxygluconokinase